MLSARTLGLLGLVLIWSCSSTTSSPPPDRDAALTRSGHETESAPASKPNIVIEFGQSTPLDGTKTWGFRLREDGTAELRSFILGNDTWRISSQDCLAAVQMIHEAVLTLPAWERTGGTDGNTVGITVNHGDIHHHFYWGKGEPYADTIDRLIRLLGIEEHRARLERPWPTMTPTPPDRKR